MIGSYEFVLLNIFDFLLQIHDQVTLNENDKFKWTGSVSIIIVDFFDFLKEINPYLYVKLIY